MKSFYQSMVLAIGVLFLLSGLALAQTSTVNFNNGSCTTVETCGLAGGTNRLIESSGDNFFFQEQIVLNGKMLNHTIVRGKPDGSTGAAFSQETFTPGGAIQGATNTASTDQLTFKQSLKAADGSVDSLVRMDNLNIINKGTGVGQENMVGTEINITQSIVDSSQGLNKNLVTLTPNTATAATGDFNTHIEQTMTDPTTSTFSSDLKFDTGAAATVNQSF